MEINCTGKHYNSKIILNDCSEEFRFEWTGGFSSIDVDVLFEPSEGASSLDRLRGLRIVMKAQRVQSLNDVFQIPIVHVTQT